MHFSWAGISTTITYINPSPTSKSEICTGRFIMFSVITNIYNKKTKGRTLMELFTATGKLKKFLFWQLEMFDVCTTGDTAHIDMIFKFLPHTRQHGRSDILHCCNDPWLRSAKSHGNGETNILAYLCTKCTLHSNHRLTRVLFQHTKRFIPRSGHFLTTYARIALQQEFELRWKTT